MSIKPSDRALAYAAAYVPPPAVPRPQLLGRGVLSVGPDPTIAPQVGDCWWRTHADGALYLWYDDGSSGQWVTANPVTGGVPTGPRWLEFPNPPLTLNQQFTATNGVTYQWDGQVWVAVSLGAAGGTVQIPGNLGVGGNTTIGGTLTVTGTATFADLVVTDPTPTFVVGSIDGAFLKPGTVAGGVGGSLATNTVYDTNIHDVGWAKVTGAPAFLTAPVTDAQIASLSWGKVTGAPAFLVAPVTRAQMAVNAPCGVPVTAAIPASTIWGTGGALAFTTLASLSITTRGGSVLLQGGTSMVCTGAAAGTNIGLRWLRDGATALGLTYYNITVANYVPLPLPHWIDPAPAAGTHTYALQLSLDANAYAQSSQNAGAGIQAMEVG